MPIERNNPPRPLHEIARELQTLRPLVQATQNPSPRTSFEYVELLAKAAAARLEQRKQTRRDPSSRARLAVEIARQLDVARQLEAFQRAFRGVLKNELEKLERQGHPELLDSAAFRAEISNLDKRIAEYAEVAGRPPTPEKTLALEEVALGFNGLTNQGVSLDPVGGNRFVAEFAGSGKYSNLKDWVRMTLGPGSKVARGILEHPSLSRVEAAFSDWESKETGGSTLPDWDHTRDLSISREKLQAQRNYLTRLNEARDDVPTTSSLSDEELRQLNRLAGGRRPLQERVEAVTRNLHEVEYALYLRLPPNELLGWKARADPQLQ